MLDPQFQEKEDVTVKYPVGALHHDIVTALAELQSQKKLTDSEITNIKVRLETDTHNTHEQLKNLEKSVSQIRDMARDAYVIGVGVDGKNGLRGSLESLARDVTRITEDFEFLRQTAHSYVEIRSFLLRLFVASAATILLQFGGAIWYASSQYSRQESLRNDMNRVISYIDKRSEESSRQALK